MLPSQLTFNNSTPQCQGHRYMDLWCHGLMDQTTAEFFVLATNTNTFIFSQKKWVPVPKPFEPRMEGNAAGICSTCAGNPINACKTWYWRFAQHQYYLCMSVVAVDGQMQMKVKKSHHQSITGLILHMESPSVLLPVVIDRVAQKHTICSAHQEYLKALSVVRVLINRGASLKLRRKHLSFASRFYSPYTIWKTAGAT